MIKIQSILISVFIILSAAQAEAKLYIITNEELKAKKSAAEESKQTTESTVDTKTLAAIGVGALGLLFGGYKILIPFIKHLRDAHPKTDSNLKTTPTPKPSHCNCEPKAPTKEELMAQLEKISENLENIEKKISENSAKIDEKRRQINLAEQAVKENDEEINRKKLIELYEELTKLLQLDNDHKNTKEQGYNDARRIRKKINDLSETD